MRNFNGGIMSKVKTIALAAILILFSSHTQAEEYEGLFQKAYKKFILKEKTVENKPALKSENIDATRELSNEGAETIANDGAYDGMSKIEMIRDIKDEVDSEEEILDQIPELKKEKDKDGKDIYTYLVDGKQVNLEDVDEKILQALLEQVGKKAGQIRASARQEQEEQLRTIRSFHPPQPPRLPEQPPRLPERPPSAPRVDKQR
jgi:hypothetical protein